MPRLYKFKKGNRRIPLEIKKNGAHDLIIEFGVLPPDGDINTVQPMDKRVFKRVTVSGIKGAPEVVVKKDPPPPDPDLLAKQKAELERKKKEAEDAAQKAKEAQAAAELARQKAADEQAKRDKENAEKLALSKATAERNAKAKAAEKARYEESERVRLEEEARLKAEQEAALAAAAAKRAKKTYTPAEVKKKEEVFKEVIKENTFDEYYDYITKNPDDPFVQEAVDSIKEIPIHFEIKEKVETSKDVFVFKIELDDVKDAKVEKNSSDSLLQTEIRADNTLTITTKDTKTQNVTVRDTFERKLQIDIDPNYKTFTVDIVENEEKDSLAFVVDGGMSPFVFRMVQKGTRIQVCPQKFKRNTYVIAKQDLDCDLNGLYRVEVQDSRRIEKKRSKDYIEFIDSSFSWIWIVSILFLLILIAVGYVIWKNL